MPMTGQEPTLLSVVPGDGSASGLAVMLADQATRAGLRNPVDGGTVSGVTLTTPASPDGTLTNKWYGPQFAGVMPRDVFSYHGGTPTQIPGQGWFLFPAASQAPQAGGNLSGYLTATPSLSAWTWEAEFMTDAPLLEILYLPATPTLIRMLVDRLNVTAGPITPPSFAGQQVVRLDFAGSRRVRRIGLRGCGPSGFRGVQTTLLDSVWKSDQAGVLKVAVTGDSFGEGAGVTVPYDPDANFVQQLGHLMGWRDVRQVAVGSTGYLANAVGTRSTVRQQVAFWDFLPDVIVCAAGYNDTGTGQNPAATAAEARLAWAAMRAKAPTAVLFVTGVWGGRRGPGQATLDMEAALHAAFVGWADPNSFWVPVSIGDSPYLFGTGYAGATNGTGNSDVYMGPDAEHPNDAGHAYLARRLAAALRNIIGML